MPVWLQVIIAIFGLVGTILGIFGISAYINERMKHKATRRNQEEDLREAEIAELKHQKHLEELRAVIREENAGIKADIETIKINLELNTKGTVTILRNDMKKSLDYFKAQGYMSHSDKTNWRELYNTYGELGGNHFREFVNGWRDELEDIPTEKPKRTTRKKLNENK